MPNEPAAVTKSKTKIRVAVISAVGLIIAAAVPVLWNRSAASSKRSDPPSTQTAVSAQSSLVAREQSITALAPIKAYSARFLDSLAAHRGLRKLEILETGKPMISSAVGTSFYVMCTSLAHFRSDSLQLDGTADRSQEFRSHYNVHHLLDGTFVLIAFTSGESASRAAASSDSGAELTLFSIPFEQADTPVLIPFVRVKSASTRTLSNGVDVIDVKTVTNTSDGHGSAKQVSDYS